MAHFVRKISQPGYILYCNEIANGADTDCVHVGDILIRRFLFHQAEKESG